MVKKLWFGLKTTTFRPSNQGRFYIFTTIQTNFVKATSTHAPKTPSMRLSNNNVGWGFYGAETRWDEMGGSTFTYCDLSDDHIRLQKLFENSELRMLLLPLVLVVTSVNSCSTQLHHPVFWQYMTYQTTGWRPRWASVRNLVRKCAWWVLTWQLRCRRCVKCSL